MICSTPICHKVIGLWSAGLTLAHFGVICVQEVGAFDVICTHQVGVIWRHMQQRVKWDGDETAQEKEIWLCVYFIRFLYIREVARFLK